MLSSRRTDISCGPGVEKFAMSFSVHTNKDNVVYLCFAGYVCLASVVWCCALVACLWVCVLVYEVFRVCVCVCCNAFKGVCVSLCSKVCMCCVLCVLCVSLCEGCGVCVSTFKLV